MAAALSSPTLDWISEESILNGTSDLPERGNPRPISVPLARPATVVEEEPPPALWGDEWNTGGTGGAALGRREEKIPLGSDWGAEWDLDGGTARAAQAQAGKVDASGMRDGIDAGWF